MFPRRLINKFKNRKKQTTNEKQWYDQVRKKAEDEWEQLWDEIYKLQETLPQDLPNDEDELLKRGFCYTYGKNGEKLIITKELSHKLFVHRMMH